MRYIRYAFLLILAIVLVTVAFANRELVTLRALPEGMSGLLPTGLAIQIPLFLVIFGAVIAGVALGFVWEWMREHRQRADAAAARREKDKLAREVDRLRGKHEDKGDEVLRLLDGA